MHQSFKLYTGELAFDGEKIAISDNAGKQTKYRMISSCIWVFYGAMSVLRFLNTQDQFLLWTGLVIGLSHLGLMIGIYFSSSQAEINLKEVQTMQVKRRFGNEFLDIKLSNNKTRRVSLIKGTAIEVEQWIATVMAQK